MANELLISIVHRTEWPLAVIAESITHPQQKRALRSAT